jgi:hypothetical protein
MREKQPKIAAWFNLDEALQLKKFAIENNIPQTKILKLALRNLLESDFKELPKKYNYNLPLITVKLSIQEYYDFKTLCKMDNIKMAKKIREFIKIMMHECT